MTSVSASAPTAKSELFAITVNHHCLLSMGILWYSIVTFISIRRYSWTLTRFFSISFGKYLKIPGDYWIFTDVHRSSKKTRFLILPNVDIPDAEITKAHFGGTLMGHSSYVTLTPPPFLTEHFELRFHFVTDDSQQVSLLLFIGPTDQANAEHRDFMAVSFIRGHVALTWDLGSGTRRIFTASPVRISATGGHSVHIGRRGRVAWLQVNNQPTVTGRSPGPASLLTMPPEIFLGMSFFFVCLLGFLYSFATLIDYYQSIISDRYNYTYDQISATCKSDEWELENVREQWWANSIDLF